jgi:penicillin V acylase-like amidase (Ntn superfamily)
MFLAGRTATVSDILTDVDGTTFVAVTLDDPGGDLMRSYHFAPDEIEVMR